jgi:F-type H+-transporting ATPase subunit epsilon
VVEVMRTEGEATEKIFIAGGFADVSQTNCTILAEEAVPVANLNADKLSAEIENLKGNLSGSDNDEERASLNKKLSIVNAMLDAVKVA